MSKKIYLKKDNQEGFLKGAYLCADAVVSTLGPSGKNVVIHQSGEEPFITKDGVTVAESIELEDKLENSGAQIIKKVSSKTDQDSGDGTTTAMVICREILKEGIALQADDDFDPYLFKTMIEKCLDSTLETILKRSKQDINLDDLARIATISANNDERIGNLFKDAFKAAGTDGYINIMESVTGESYVTNLNGFVIDLGYADRSFINNRKTGFFEAKECYVVLYDEELTDRKQASAIVRHFVALPKRRPVLIFAKEISKEVQNVFEYNNMDLTGPGFCVVKNHLRNNEYKNIMSDIAAFTGAEIVDRFEEFSEVSGIAKNVQVKAGHTVFGEPNESQLELFEDYCNELLSSVEEEVSVYITEDVKKRVAKMKKGVTTFYVGAASDIELKEKKHRVEDAYKACRAAVEKGIIIGGGQSLYLISKQFRIKKAHPYTSAFWNAIEKPFFQILENANHTKEKINEIAGQVSWDRGYNAKSRQFEDLMESGVIDPVKVQFSSLINAVSIASTMLSTECVIIEK